MTGDKGERDAEKTVFRYNRERRLEHAPESVRKAYDEGYMPNRGFIKGLTSNVGLRSIFVTIVILCAVIGVLVFFGKPSGSASIAGVPLKLKSFLYEETIYSTVSLSESGWNGKNSVPVRVQFEGIDANGMTITSAIATGNYSGTALQLRATMPDHEIKTVSAAVSFGADSLPISVQVDRK